MLIMMMSLKMALFLLVLRSLRRTMVTHARQLTSSERQVRLRIGRVGRLFVKNTSETLRKRLNATVL
ncbi:hypothetical protein C450_06135 [Halococcus salifodinae DSM 8989]|uniref:Uncharacterized protein n=1 Tax=Halococcus salifodinae DSM 8989 TaxID=1227456 RepID=M0N925_9EURY|nr:hypothetical protein C450_06135 [Halococcus salifodinae DSM 8989]